MFTGRIENVGTVAGVAGEVLRVASDVAVAPGGAVCLDGIRFTAAPAPLGELRVVVTDETRRRTTLDRVAAGLRMNVERPVAIGDRIDGHLIQGHVEGVGRVLRVDREPAGHRVWLKPPERLLSQLVAKTSIAVDGVSITVAEVLKDRFSVVLVPNMLTKTTLGALAAGDRVNLESDLLVRMARDGHGPELMRAVAQLPWAGQLSGEAGVQKVVAQIAAGGGVVVWDPTAEAEGDVVFAGERFRPEAMRFLLTQACGHTTVPCAPEVLQRLKIGPIPGDGDRQGTAMHVFPLAARPGLPAERGGHTEATVALCKAAGLAPVGVCCEVMRTDGVMAGPADLEQFALRWELPMINIHDLARWL
ncbi:3,4-dihydroxy-2-butanone-4-phosphate synthase [Kribbella sp. WER1]